MWGINCLINFQAVRHCLGGYELADEAGAAFHCTPSFGLLMVCVKLQGGLKKGLGAAGFSTNLHTTSLRRDVHEFMNINTRSLCAFSFLNAWEPSEA